MSWQVCRGAGGRRRWYVNGARCVQTGDFGVVYLLGVDVGDVGTGVECLVGGVVKVGGVADLESRVCPWGGAGWRVGDGDAAVSGVNFGGEASEGGEVGLDFRIWIGS